MRLNCHNRHPKIGRYHIAYHITKQQNRLLSVVHYKYQHTSTVQYSTVQYDTVRYSSTDKRAHGILAYLLYTPIIIDAHHTFSDKKFQISLVCSMEESAGLVRSETTTSTCINRGHRRVLHGERFAPIVRALRVAQWARIVQQRKVFQLSAICCAFEKCVCLWHIQGGSRSSRAKYAYTLLYDADTKHITIWCTDIAMNPEVLSTYDSLGNEVGAWNIHEPWKYVITSRLPYAF